MKPSTPWITYRTRFLVKAKQLTTSLTFIDLLGRQHSGRKGDYLVESSDGVLSIAPKRIFEDIYVPVLANETTSQDEIPLHETYYNKCGESRPRLSSGPVVSGRSRTPTPEGRSPIQASSPSSPVQDQHLSPA
jgi:hypothetical protein